MKNTKFTEEEIESLKVLYKDLACQYLLERELVLEKLTEYPNLYVVKRKVSFDSYSLNKKTILSKEEQFKEHIYIKFPGKNIMWDNHNGMGYQRSFYKLLYNSANEKQREILRSYVFILDDIFELTHSLYESPKELKKFIDHSSHLYGDMIKSATLKTLVSIWKDIFSEKDFNEALTNFLLINKKKCHFKNSSIHVRYVLSNYVHDESTYEYITNELFGEEKVANIFVDNNYTIFEFSVTREELMKYISLVDNNSYTYIHENIVQGLNSCQKLGIASCEILNKSESSNQCTMLIKLYENSSLTKEKFKTILLSLYKSYEELAANIDYPAQLKNKITPQWVQHSILDQTIPNKTEKPTKTKNKI